MSEHNAFEAVIDVALELLAPLVDAARGEREVIVLLDEMGWSAPEVDLVAIGTAIAALIESIEALRPGLSFDSLEDLTASLASLRVTTTALTGFASALAASVGAATAEPELIEALSADLSQHLLVRYIGLRPAVYGVLALFGLIDNRTVTALSTGGAEPLLTRVEVTKPGLEPGTLGKLVRDPIGHLRGRLHVQPLSSQEVAERVAMDVFGPILDLVTMAGGGGVVGVGGVEVELPAPEDVADRRRVTLLATLPSTDVSGEPTESVIALVVDLVHAGAVSESGDAGPGILVSVEGTMDLAASLPGAEFRLAIAGGPFTAFFPTGGTPVLHDASDGATIEVSYQGVPVGAGGRARLGATTGTRLEVGTMSVSGRGHIVSGVEPTFGIVVEMRKAAFVLGGGDGDGFLNKVLPAAGVRAEFDVALGWSNRRGFHLGGTGGLETALPINASFLGVVSVDTLHLAIQVREEGNVELIIAVTAAVKLGPFAAALEQVGLRTELGWPSMGGNLALGDLVLGFRPPKGVGLAITAPAVKGSGYLFFDADKQEYAGAAQLELAGFSLSAVALLTTRPGEFSLLVIISVKFAPIQLGYGFTLNGVGGLLGVNRTIALEEIQNALGQGALDAVLFPQAPDRNPAALVSTLARFFPAVQDQYVLGPSVIIGWGTPTVLTITLGVLIEFPSPTRIVLAGQLRMVLPDGDDPVAIVQIDLLGSLDLTRGRVSVDASLRDSRVAQFAIAGDVAIRASWGKEPGFLIAAGGFNPRFKAPAGLRPLDRLSISLASGNNPRLRLEAYFALTANTVQFGARLDLYAEADVGIGIFSVTATLGFDALLQFSPFAFIVDIYASVVLRWGGEPFLGIDLALTLSGPTPWAAQGEASFHFLGTHTIRFELTVGEEPDPSAPELVDVLGELRKAVVDPRSWETQRPPDGRTLVIVRDSESPGAVVAHPRGALIVRQHVVPLEREITRFGTGRPLGATSFTLALEAADGSPVPTLEHITDLFAPAQFFDLTEAERLSSPSFVPMQAGARFSASGFRLPDSSGIHDVDDIVYEEHVFDEIDVVPVRRDGLVAPAGPDRTPEAIGTFLLPDDDALMMAGGGAAGRNGEQTAGTNPFIGVPAEIALSEPTFRLASTASMTSVEGVPDRDLDWEEAADLLDALRSEQPERSQMLQIIAAHEVLA